MALVRSALSFVEVVTIKHSVLRRHERNNNNHHSDFKFYLKLQKTLCAKLTSSVFVPKFLCACLRCWILYKRANRCRSALLGSKGALPFYAQTGPPYCFSPIHSSVCWPHFTILYFKALYRFSVGVKWVENQTAKLAQRSIYKLWPSFQSANYLLENRQKC